jgi:hypothetical protein
MFFNNTSENVSRHRSERQTNEPNISQNLYLDSPPNFETPMQSDSQLTITNDLEGFPNVSKQNLLNSNDSVAQDVMDGKVVIPTFEEFLEYILSTDLQGNLTETFVISLQTEKKLLSNKKKNNKHYFNR